MFKDIEENEPRYIWLAIIGALFGLFAFAGLLATVEDAKIINRYGGTDGVHVTATVVWAATDTGRTGYVATVVEYPGPDGALIRADVVAIRERPEVGSNLPVVYPRADPFQAIDASRLDGPLGTNHMHLALLALVGGTIALLLGISSTVALLRLYRRRRREWQTAAARRHPPRDLGNLKLWIDDNPAP